MNPDKAPEMSIETFAGAIHDDDRERIVDAVGFALRTVEPYAADYGPRDIDGAARRGAMRGRVEYDKAGHLLRFPDVLVDITERKRAERESERFEVIADSANGPGFLVDEGGRFIYVNRVACESLGCSGEGLPSMSVCDIDPSSTKMGALHALARVHRGRSRPLRASTAATAGPI